MKTNFRYSLAIVGLWALIVIPSAWGQDVPMFKNVNSQKAASLIETNKANPDFTILDVRTNQEYQAGHLANSTQLDFYSQGFAEQLSKLDKDKTYLIYCHSGARSGRSFNLMKELGFKNVYNISKGITGWKAAGQPVTQK